MSIETGRAYLRARGYEDRIQEFSVSSATVELAAQAVGCEPARIAKTLSFAVDGGCVLIVRSRCWTSPATPWAACAPSASITPL